jgi:hypothetical protein
MSSPKNIDTSTADPNKNDKNLHHQTDIASLPSRVFVRSHASTYNKTNKIRRLEFADCGLSDVLASNLPDWNAARLARKPNTGGV